MESVNVNFAYLFGSQTKGNIGPVSDIDIAVFIDCRDEDAYASHKMEILGKLNDTLKTDNIDLVLLNEAPPLLAHRILKEGEIIYCEDEKKRLDYEESAILKYLDFKPYLEKYAREALK